MTELDGAGVPGPALVEHDREPRELVARPMLPVRPMLVLGLAVAPFAFFLNPPGWVWALMLAPDAVPLRCPPWSTRAFGSPTSRPNLPPVPEARAPGRGSARHGPSA